ncbi:helix-turn-helix transcriptional regulator [Halomonas sp. ML-15]|uniref:helix-turn-helix transcriptional regulator n=1 Tax=Halomonas sp. ML-15 TaxID=2773305 RepID=UPI001746F99A|nr:helix-turn-helix transcriptional regulator [Halomonas sp. ML-15]MBD3896465.1 helix-turn-helix transcriptional regulator [Halomonas sp. ML-15]
MTMHQFSSVDFPSNERLDMAHDIYAAMASVQLDVPHKTAPEIDVRIHLLPGVSIALVTSSPLVAMRGRWEVANSSDDLSLLVCPDGEGEWVSRQKEEIVCRPGSGCLGINGLPGRVEFRGRRSRFLSISFSRDLLGPSIADLDKAAKTPLVANRSNPLQLLTRLAMTLTRPDAPVSGEQAPMIVNQLIDLALLSLGAKPEAQALARGRGLRQARFRAIRADMAVLALRGDITLPEVAGRHGVSPGYLRALFRQAGTSFTDVLLQQRLERTFLWLSNTRHAETPVSTIAFNSGFNNLSWFYRAFRQRYAMAPNEVRERAGIL